MLFITFNALVTWIAKNKCGIGNLALYSDDSLGVKLMSDFTYYEPYQNSYPASQAVLLELWDELGIPHKEKKQNFRPKLTIIGIDVDADKLIL